MMQTLDFSPFLDTQDYFFFLSEDSISKIQFPYSGQRMEDIRGRRKTFNISFSLHYPNRHYLLDAVF